VQHFIRAEIRNDNYGDFSGEFDHALKKPRRRLTAVQRKVSDTSMPGACGH
jgi:hypothetical protein